MRLGFFSVNSRVGRNCTGACSGETFLDMPFYRYYNCFIIGKPSKFFFSPECDSTIHKNDKIIVLKL